MFSLFKHQDVMPPREPNEPLRDGDTRPYPPDWQIKLPPTIPAPYVDSFYDDGVNDLVHPCV